jgi:hypothetical protein
MKTFQIIILSILRAIAALFIFSGTVDGFKGFSSGDKQKLKEGAIGASIGLLAYHGLDRWIDRIKEARAAEALEEK